MLRKPPDILITTPESLYLLLTSQAREMLRGVETRDPRRDARGRRHEARRAPRALARAARPARRRSRSSAIGLSATQRPLEEIGRFVSGGRADRARRRGHARRSSTSRSSCRSRTCASRVRASSSRGCRRHRAARAAAPRSGRRSTRRSSSSSAEHRSTIVFVNNRRLAERLALRLNELAEEEIARAHHGSLAREQRVEIEELLKAGRIPCLVATSSLELGIDMGAVDLVIQVESPKSVARGLQRIGRAGHELGAVSKGRIFPKFRADLLEAAVVARRMREGAIEETVIPRNPLDVLAQQIVAICADEEIAVDELHELVRGAYPFADLSRVQLENVLDMLAGPLPVRRVRRAAAADRLGPHRRASSAGGRARGGSRSRTPARSPTAASSACTSPTAAAASASSTRRWSTRRARGRRSCSAPRPGGSRRSPATACSSRRRRACRARCRSGRARASGRPFELGEAIGAASRELVALTDEKALERLRERATRSTSAPPRTCSRSSASRQAATGAVPSDRTIVVERFRDEIGDWRVCILTPFGARVHAPWAMALGARLRDALGLETPGDLVGRRDRAPPARRRRAAADRGPAARPGRGRGARRRSEVGRDGALRRALPRERRRGRC